MPRINKIQVRRDAAATWTSANPTLAAGEIGFETDTGKLKVGTGSATWTALTYVGAIGTGSITSAMILDGTILDADINVSAAIASSKVSVVEPSANTNAAASVGFVGMPQNVLASGGLTLSKAHAGEHIYVTGTGQTITIPANGSVPLEIGTTVVIVNAADVTTSVAITTDTLILANSAVTGTVTLASNGIATLLKITSTSWIISGNGLS